MFWDNNDQGDNYVAKSSETASYIHFILWKCKIILGDMDHADIRKDIIYGLFFIKLASYVFLERKQQLLEMFENDKNYIHDKSLYFSRNVLYMRETSTWQYLIANVDKDDICEKIENAINDMKNDNIALKGAIPSGVYKELNDRNERIKMLINEIDKIEETEMLVGGDLIKGMRIIQRIGNCIL